MNPNFCYSLATPQFPEGGNQKYREERGEGNRNGFYGLKKRPREQEDEEYLQKHVRSSMFQHPITIGLAENNIYCSSFSLMEDGDLFNKILKEQEEVDRLISIQTEKLKLEFQNKMKLYWNNMFHALEDVTMSVLRSKEEEIGKLSRRNSVLEEQAINLSMEGQVWRRLAEAKEEAAKVLRRDIEIVHSKNKKDNVEVEDSASCWKVSTMPKTHWYCRSCRIIEASVLLLPCRHLCLCKDCNEKSNSCPICMHTKNASLDVHLP